MSAIKLLMLEDNDLDAQLTLRELRSMEQEFDTKIVSEKYEFEREVQNWSPDLIISDFNLQTFNGDEALAFAKKVSPDTPFITLSGSITKNMEVTLLKERANDVLTKDNLKRLPFAINRVLKEKGEQEKLNATLVELEDNLKFQEALAEISIIFNSSEVFADMIEKALKKIGEVTNVSRVYIFEESEDTLKYSNTYEWCAEGVEPQIGNLKNVPYSDTPSLRPMLIREEEIYADNISTLPQDLINVLEPQDIKALMVRPLFLADKFFGFIGLDEIYRERKWSKSEDKLLKSISGIISNAYSEYLAQKELLTKNKKLNHLLKEKEMLVGEVHHRVKNNLALISSFLQLEKFGVTKSDSIEQLIEANILRVRSIGIVHETVYKKGSFSDIDVLSVLKEIIQSTFSGKPDLVSSIEIDKPDSSVTFNINTAVPFSLLVSEVMFQVLNLIKAEDLDFSERIILSASEDAGSKSIFIEQPELTKALLKLKTEDEFTEVIEVLTNQIKAKISVLPGGKVSKITFFDKNVKGSSSAVQI